MAMVTFRSGRCGLVGAVVLAATLGCSGDDRCQLTATCPWDGGSDDQAAAPSGSQATDDEQPADDAEPTVDEDAVETDHGDGPSVAPSASPGQGGLLVPLPPGVPTEPGSGEPAPGDAGTVLDASSVMPNQGPDAGRYEADELGTDEAETDEAETDEAETDELATDEADASTSEPQPTPDYCMGENGGCDPLSACESTPDGAVCGGCPSGYAGDGTTGCAPTLLALGLSHGTLSPELEPDLDVYDIEVPVFIESVTLSPEVPAGASVTIRGAAVQTGMSWASPPLQVGENSFELTVEQAGQPSSTITLRVNRGSNEIAYLKESNTGAGDYFGSSVALSADGSTLAVGAPREESGATGVGGDENNDDIFRSGAVYVFVRSGNNWVQQAYVKASNTGDDDNFGVSLALSADGSVLAVGSSNEDSNATGTSGAGQNNDTALDAGAVYVFERVGGGWSQQAYLKASNTDAGDGFGGSVALTGDGKLLAVGASGEDSNATGTGGTGQTNDEAVDAGAVYIFGRSDSGWSQQAYLKASNTDAEDGFGYPVAWSSDGSTLAVGATGEDSSATGTSGSGQNSDDASAAGAVYVFAKGASTWSQQAYVKASNAGAGDFFGVSIGLSSDGNTLAVGADGEDSKSKGVTGANQQDDTASNAGAAYVFVRSSTSWSQEAYLKASNTDLSDGFGVSLGLSADGSTLAVGASRESSAAMGAPDGDQTDNTFSGIGAAYVFGRQSARWSQHAYLKASNTVPGYNFFGAVLSISGDGNAVAVAAPTESNSATGTSGNDSSVDDSGAQYSGAVYVFR